MKRNARPSTRGPVSGFLRQAARLVKGLLPKTLTCSAGFLCGAIVQSLFAHCFELCDLRRAVHRATPRTCSPSCAGPQPQTSRSLLRARTRSEVYGGVRIGDGGHRPPCVAAASIRACRPSRNPPSEDPSLQQMPRRNHGLRASLSRARTRWGVRWCTDWQWRPPTAMCRGSIHAGMPAVPEPAVGRPPPSIRSRAATPDVARVFSRTRVGGVRWCTVWGGGGCRSW